MAVRDSHCIKIARLEALDQQVVLLDRLAEGCFASDGEIALPKLQQPTNPLINADCLGITGRTRIEDSGCSRMKAKAEGHSKRQGLG